MYEKPFTLEIVGPERVVFSGEATSFSAPGIEGGFQVLVHHAPFLSSLAVGEIKVKTMDGRDARYATSGGFVEVRGNHVVALVEAAERADEIDVTRASASRERAETRLRVQPKDIDVDRARASLHRALNRLRIAAKT
jgi:F-type H+-transporting ATPase subunit epsilon